VARLPVGCLAKDSLVVIVDRDRQYPLGAFLTNDILVEVHDNLAWAWAIRLAVQAGQQWLCWAGITPSSLKISVLRRTQSSQMKMPSLPSMSRCT
jgi:hypothetical protein